MHQSSINQIKNINQELTLFLLKSQTQESIQQFLRNIKNTCEDVLYDEEEQFYKEYLDQYAILDGLTEYNE